MLPLSLSLPSQGWGDWLTALALNALLIGVAQRAPLLTPSGWLHAGSLGTLLWGSRGWRGWLAVVACTSKGAEGFRALSA